VETIAGNLMLTVEQKQFILEQKNYIARLEGLLEILCEENEILLLEKEINDKVKEKIDDNQREYYLREQIKVISEELGEEEDTFIEAQKYKEQILSLKLCEDSEIKLLKECDKLSKLPYGSHEGSVIRNYLDTCISLPWNIKTKDKLDIKKASIHLNKEHYGLEIVKERILEFIAVKKLSPNKNSQIICLQGPPGVGKTSIAKSLATAIGRKYVRISLGGVRDESEIRGHRKTYVGSMPGRIIDAIKTAGVKNPLICLDEIDKMSNDFRGDPTSAMLEVLDSEQNSTFRDHYIELPFDLSEVLFITTSNDVYSIPAPLRDRMEIIELSSYTREEKFNIVKKHLLSKQLKKHGLTAKQLKIKDNGIYSIIDSYTREAGVRQAERLVATICRKTAKKIVSSECEKLIVDEKNITEFLGTKKYKSDKLNKENQIGTVTGLAWTSVGGETMDIECSAIKGDGKIIVTGNLGDIMKESAKIAISYVRKVAEKYAIEEDFYKKYDLHIHAPEGAVPKDGPSAGVTITTAIISELAQIPVKRDTAMTGEISLKGKVMPIGGLKEKSMAAYRLGIKTIIIPEENTPDLEDIDQVVKNNINFISASKLDEVLENALIKQQVNVTVNKEVENKIEFSPLIKKDNYPFKNI
ncbi:MAG: endopeptidase La, partial [Oscillospiraceae bacterium]